MYEHNGSRFTSNAFIVYFSSPADSSPVYTNVELNIRAATSSISCEWKASIDVLNGDRVNVQYAEWTSASSSSSAPVAAAILLLHPVRPLNLQIHDRDL